MLRKLIASFTLIAALLIGAGPAQAACGVGAPRLLNYSFSQTYRVEAIAKYNEYLPDCGASISNSDIAPVGNSLLTDIFAKRDPVGRTLLLGIATNLPGDPEGQQHLVLFTNPGWAASASGIAFGTLFPTTLEGALINALNNLATGNGMDADYDLLFNFVDNVRGGGQFNSASPNGDPAFQFGSSFAAIAFSDGQIIGTGESFYSDPQTGAVPEPATWAMMIAGMGLVGGTMRSRRTSAARLAAA